MINRLLAYKYFMRVIIIKIVPKITISYTNRLITYRLSVNYL